MSAFLQELRSRVTKNTASVARPIDDNGTFTYSSPQTILVDGSVNEAEMSAEFVVISDVEDRENDIIDPQGCLEYLEDYRRNPVVLLEHDALKPIGLSTDKAGTFHFRVLSDRVIAKCFFHCLPLNGENLSEEVFRLVMKGIFRGASPGFLPIRGRRRGYGKDDGYHYSTYRLTEWSLTAQPVNQLALKMSLSGVRCKSLKRRLESLVLPKAKASSIVTLDNPVLSIANDNSLRVITLLKEAKSMSKPKTASIEFDKSIFTEEKAAVAWLDQHGYDSSSCVPLPASFVFKQRIGKINAGQKSLGKGVVALQTNDETLTLKARKMKAFGKDDEKDDEDKKDEKPGDMADEKVEKGDDEEKDDESQALEDEEVADADDDAADDEIDDEGEESAEGEADAEDATEYDPEALKKEADNLVDMIAHFEIACEHAERMKGESVKSPELFDKLHADATALVADLRAAYKDGFADQAMESAIDERKAGAVEKEAEPVDSAEASPDEYKETMKALKALETGLSAAKNTAKSLPRLAVA